jgi:hypothetical protein
MNPRKQIILEQRQLAVTQSAHEIDWKSPELDSIELDSNELIQLQCKEHARHLHTASTDLFTGKVARQRDPFGLCYEF